MRVFSLQLHRVARAGRNLTSNHPEGVTRAYAACVDELNRVAALRNPIYFGRASKSPDSLGTQRYPKLNPIGSGFALT